MYGGKVAVLERLPDYMLRCTQGSDQILCSPPRFTIFFVPGCLFTQILGYIQIKAKEYNI